MEEGWLFIGKEQLCRKPNSCVVKFRNSAANETTPVSKPAVFSPETTVDLEAFLAVEPNPTPRDPRNPNSQHFTSSLTGG